MYVLSRWQRVGIGVLSLALAAGFVNIAFRHYRASYWATASQQPLGLQKAISLEPGDASLHHRLGQYIYLTDLDADAALPHYQDAVTLNPFSGRNWLDLAMIWEVKGEAKRQENAMRQGLAAEPYTPEVLWGVANFHLVRGEIDDAVPLLRRFTEAKSSIEGNVDTTAMNAVWRATHDVDLLADRVLPPTSAYRSALVLFLLQRNDLSAAAKAWKRLIELGQRFDVLVGLTYVNSLMQQNAIETAAKTWNEMGAAIPEFRSHLPSDDLVVNGGFEEELLDAGFEWRLNPRPNTTLSVDAGQFHGGNRSLRIDFDGEAGADTGLSQTVVVKPNTRYKFSAFMRAEDILSASGPRFVIIGNDGERYFTSGDLIGSSFWRESESNFATGPATKTVTISVMRDRGESRIKGTVWVDDVTLRELR